MQNVSEHTKHLYLPKYETTDNMNCVASWIYILFQEFTKFKNFCKHNNFQTLMKWTCNFVTEKSGLVLMTCHYKAKNRAGKSTLINK